MEVMLSVPEVTECAAEACGYNVDRRCHAQAITIGDGLHPRCDTFMPSTQHVSPAPRAGVGACKVSRCTHNRDYICHANAVRIGVHRDHPDCFTYAVHREA